MKKVVSHKLLKRCVTRQKWKLHLRVAESILNENCPQSNLWPDEMSNLHDVAHSSDWQIFVYITSCYNVAIMITKISSVL